MGVVIDQVVGRVEPDRGPAADGPGGTGGGAPAPVEPKGTLQCQLRRLERRRLRLEAD